MQQSEINTFAETALDPRIKFPSYKSFDEFIDVERLKSLDAYITERIERRLQLAKDLEFYTGPFTLDAAQKTKPGTKMIYLSRSKMPGSYFDLDKTELWEPSENVEEFRLLMDFIETLPFRATGRMMIIYDTVARPVTAHRDHTETNICHEFIWFRTNLNKPFYMLDPDSGAKQYVESHSAWFDSVNQFHGGDGYSGLSFSIRVDGKFTDEFKRQIPVPADNLASMPSLWACTAG